MRIGCLQFSPQVGDIENNLNRADAVLSKANPDELDLLVLPELAFSGYNFRSLRDIMPFLEPSGSGISSLWARTMALRYNCTVTVGYPEKVDVSSNWPTGPEYYNSTIVVNGEGETIANYRKRFLYYTDESWALEGDQGFYDGCIPGLGNTSIGICMDLNPYKFEAPWHAFEFAFHVLEVESNLVIISMAWMTREDRRKYTRMPNEPDMETLTYWVTRLEPLIRSDNRDEIVVVFCNRTGVEDDVTYAGTSAVVGILDGEVKVYGILGRGEKELLVVDTNKSPYAKLIYRPPGPGARPSPGLLAKPGEALPQQEGTSQHGRAHSSGSPPTPELAAKFEEAPSRGQGTPKKRAAPIIVPKSSLSLSATSPTGDFNIPTPSAPSPTPMAVRPRLIIPESPPISPHQYTSDCPASASSMTSTLSYKSADSEASTQTIRTNPRPPEDSTPYPHSSAPLSGYPDNRWEAEKRIYGGNVTIAHYESLSPTTPFEDISPMSTRRFWGPGEPPRKLSQSANGWTAGTPVGKKPEPFPWSQISSDLGSSRRGTDKSAPTVHGIAAKDSSAGTRPPQSPASNSSSARTAPSTRSNSTKGRSSSKSDRRGTGSQNNLRSFRPSPPKSRNASRPRLGERASSTVNETESGVAMISHLQGVSRRAASANTFRSVSSKCNPGRVTPTVERPSSPKSRNCSRSRPGEAVDIGSIDPHTIPIAASPSIFRRDASTPEAKKFYQSSSRASSRQQSNDSPGETDVSRHHGTPVETGSSTALRPASRAASRGRQRGLKDEEERAPERSASKDSIVNDRLHTRVSRRESRESGASHSGRRSSRSSNHQPTLSQYEMIEVVSCSKCPVHGQHSDSSASGHNTPESAGLAKVYTPSSSDPTNPAYEDKDSQANQTPVLRESPNALTRKSSCSNFSTLEAANISPGFPTATSPSFDPPTPKAMAFQVDDVFSAPPQLEGNSFEIPTT